MSGEDCRRRGPLGQVQRTARVSTYSHELSNRRRVASRRVGGRARLRKYVSLFLHLMLRVVPRLSRVLYSRNARARTYTRTHAS